MVTDVKNDTKKNQKKTKHLITDLVISEVNYFVPSWDSLLHEAGAGFSESLDLVLMFIFSIN